jgi:hypothetical protein
MLRSLKRSIVALVLSLSFAGLSSASEPYYPVKKVTTYETRVHYENRTEWYKKHVTRYDAYGKAYTATVWYDRVVRVPVKKVVAVVKHVPAY